MILSRIFYICALLGCFGFYIAYRQWLSWLLLVGVLGLPWLSLLISIPLIRSFRAFGEGSPPAMLGGQASGALAGAARYLVPPFRGRLRFTVCNTGQTWTRRHGGVIPGDHCAGIRLEPEKVYVCDLLGLFRFRAKRVDSAVVLIRPRPIPMGDIPELDRFLARSWRPKPGGGYSEEHEMRSYRPGDNLNQVHWKLTAKTGDLVIREPQEPDRGLLLLTLDLRGSPEELDRIYGRLLWLGDQLLDRSLSFQVWALTGDGILTGEVEDRIDLRALIDQLLCSKPAGEGSILDRELNASWHRNIGGEPDEA